MGSYALHQELRSGPSRDYLKTSDVERVMEHNIKATVEVSLRRFINEILLETIEFAFAVDCGEEKEAFVTSIRNIAT